MSVLLHSKFWSQTRGMSRDEKLLFLFLISFRAASGGAFSGIYEITIPEISFYTELTEGEIKAMLTNGMRNILYDFDHGIVFVKNKLRYSRRGRPDLIEKSIIADYRQTSRAESVWNEFRRHHATFVEASTYLRQYLDGPGDEVPEKLETPDMVIGKLLEYFRNELVADDVEVVSKVLIYLFTNLRTKNYLKINKVKDMAAKVTSRPAMQITCAAHAFLECDGINRQLRFAYFWGIVRGSAQSWMIEYRRHKEKKEFELEKR